MSMRKWLALISMPRCFVHKGTCCFQPRIHVGKLSLNKLHTAQGRERFCHWTYRANIATEHLVWPHT